MFPYSETHNICFIKKLIHININLSFHVWELRPRALHYFSAECCINHVPKCSEILSLLSQSKSAGDFLFISPLNHKKETPEIVVSHTEQVLRSCEKCFCWVKMMHFRLLLQSICHDRNCFFTKHLTSIIPYKRKIYRKVENFQMTGLVLNKKKIKKPYVLTEGPMLFYHTNSYHYI